MFLRQGYLIGVCMLREHVSGHLGVILKLMTWKLQILQILGEKATLWFHKANLPIHAKNAGLRDAMASSLFW